MELNFNKIEDAITAIKNGEMIIVVDDPGRENEGDLIVAAKMADAKAVNFMITHGKGLVCVPMTVARAKALDIDLMTETNTESMKTAFTVSVDGAKYHGVTTGISASDRAKTIEILNNPESRPVDLVKPGHIFPLIAKEGGVLRRSGHTEAGVDLVKMAGLGEVAVICEIINENGQMAKGDDLFKFAKQHDLKIITIEDLIKYKLEKESFVRQTSISTMPTIHGNFTAYGYENILNGEFHVALVMGDVRNKKDVIVRVHSECLTGDVFGSSRCDCGQQLDMAFNIVAEKGEGVILYMKQEGRGIGLKHKLMAYELQDSGKDTVEANVALGFEADLRDYGTGAQILRDLGLTTIKLLTNNPRKIVGIEGYGLQVVERLPVEVDPNKYNKKYLKTKSEKLGHMLHIK